MIGLGTIINVLSIIAGGLVGIAFGKFISDSIRTQLVKVCGVCVLFVGISGAISDMLVIEDGSLSVQGSLMMILSIVLGFVVGELLGIEKWFDNFGERLKSKFATSSDNSFVNAFVTASLTVCIGAMAIVGSIEDGINGDHAILIAKSILDFVIIAVMASSMGKGAIFSAVSVGIFQGVFTIAAKLLAPIMTAEALANISIVGSVMIFCVGINLIWGKIFKVGSMLPGIIFAVLFALI